LEELGRLGRLPQFVYYLWYPGILGSMLYDLFQGPGSDHRTYAARLLVTVVYSVDYVHLFHDLPETTSKLDGLAPVLDGLIALGFGMSAALLEKSPGWSCVALVCISCAFILYYSVRAGRYLWWVVSILAIVLTTLGAVFSSTHSLLGAFLWAMTVFASLYVVYCFVIYPRLLTRGE